MPAFSDDAHFLAAPALVALSELGHPDSFALFAARSADALAGAIARFNAGKRVTK
ncbi:hypothetical protein [Marinimicrobium sp. C2-29]|uniref:hypothetical protein n=1 Tax=Marinimicrobium sp. C2-29 TaxID=3139825 RepID=UPI003139B385